MGDILDRINERLEHGAPLLSAKDLAAIRDELVQLRAAAGARRCSCRPCGHCPGPDNATAGDIAASGGEAPSVDLLGDLICAADTLRPSNAWAAYVIDWAVGEIQVLRAMVSAVEEGKP